MVAIGKESWPPVSTLPGLDRRDGGRLTALCRTSGQSLVHTPHHDHAARAPRRALRGRPIANRLWRATADFGLHELTGEREDEVPSIDRPTRRRGNRRNHDVGERRDVDRVETPDIDVTETVWPDCRKSDPSPIRRDRGLGSAV